jgi:hypothetical protein
MTFWAVTEWPNVQLGDDLDGVRPLEWLPLDYNAVQLVTERNLGAGIMY